MENRAHNILVVQGRMDHNYLLKEQANMRNIAQQAEVKLTFANALAEEGITPWDKPDALLHEHGASIVMGSSDFNLDVPSNLRDKYLNRVMPLAEKILDEGEYAQGICLGHQVFAKAAGEKIYKIADRQEVGTVQLTLTKHGQEDPVFAGLPSSIQMLYGHNRSVEALPNGFTRLGSTERDPNSVLKRDNVVTLQGHPDLTDADSFKLRIEASKLTPHPYIETHPIENPHSEIQTIIVNFMNEVKRSAK